MGQDRRDVPQTGVLTVYTEGSLRATPKASRRQLNNLDPNAEMDQIRASVWVRPATAISETVAIIAHTSWQFGASLNAERQIVCCLTVLRYSGYDDQGLTLERCEVEHPLTIRPGEINSLGDCIEDVSRAFSFVVTRAVSSTHAM